jgi:hypothetical protein
LVRDTREEIITIIVESVVDGAFFRRKIDDHKKWQKNYKYCQNNGEGNDYKKLNHGLNLA